MYKIWEKIYKFLLNYSYLFFGVGVAVELTMGCFALLPMFYVVLCFSVFPVCLYIGR